MYHQICIENQHTADTCIINDLIIQHLLSYGEYSSTHVCDWIWEKLASTYNYKYLEILILIICEVLYLRKENRRFHAISHESIPIHGLIMQ